MNNKLVIDHVLVCAITKDPDTYIRQKCFLLSHEPIHEHHIDNFYHSYIKPDPYLHKQYKSLEKQKSLPQIEVIHSPSPPPPNTAASPSHAPNPISEPDSDSDDEDEDEEEEKGDLSEEIGIYATKYKIVYDHKLNTIVNTKDNTQLMVISLVFSDFACKYENTKIKMIPKDAFLISIRDLDLFKCADKLTFPLGQNPWTFEINIKNNIKIRYHMQQPQDLVKIKRFIEQNKEKTLYPPEFITLSIQASSYTTKPRSQIRDRRRM